MSYRQRQQHAHEDAEQHGADRTIATVVNVASGVEKGGHYAVLRFNSALTAFATSPRQAPALPRK